MGSTDPESQYLDLLTDEGRYRGNPVVSARVCFTINNFTDDNLEALSVDRVFGDRPADCPWEYLIWSPEHCEDGAGTPHIQGYGELRRKARRNAIQTLLGGSLGGGEGYARIESARGTAEQNLRYISKESGGKPWFTWGTARPFRIGQGMRGDLDAMRALALEGGMRAVTALATSLQQCQFAALYLKYHERRRRIAPGQTVSVTWLWGSTGSGKSHIGVLLAGEEAFFKTEPSKWFEGYDGQKTILLNDFRPHWMGGNLETMLNLLDKYTYLAECKNGARQIVADTFVITCDRPPWSCYTGQGDIQQLVRRCTAVVEVEPPASRPEQFRNILTPESARSYVAFMSRTVDDVYPDEGRDDEVPVEDSASLPGASVTDCLDTVVLPKVSKGNNDSSSVATLDESDLTDICGDIW